MPSDVSAAQEPRLMLPGLREVYQAYARAAGELPGLPGALQAEVWTSAQLGALESAAPNAEGRRAALGDLITTLRDAGTPGARTFLKALAAIGPAGARRAAGRAAGELGVRSEPAWADALGTVTPGLAWLIKEGPLDGDRLVCEFRYEPALGTAPQTTGASPEERSREGADLHALAVRLAYGDVPAEIVIVGDVPAMMTAARQAMRAELCVVQPCDAAAMGSRLRAALNGAETYPEDCYPALALARHRASLLPGT